MRAATLFVAVLCATLPAVHGRERLRTSENDPPPPDKDGTRTGKPEDPTPTGPTKQASSFCYGYQHRLGPPTAGERRVCAIVFKKKGDNGCEAFQQERIIVSKTVPSSKVECSDENANKGAVCYCADRDCNTNNKAMVQTLGKWVKANQKQMPWLKNCPKALEQLERTLNVEKPTTQPKKDQTTNPSKPASTPKEQSRAKTTTAAPSGPDPKSTGPRKQASSFCYGYQHHLLPPTYGPPQICAIVFTKGGDRGCEAVLKLIVPKPNEVSSSDVICHKAQDKLKARCYCGGRDCNVDTDAISTALIKLTNANKNKLPWLTKCSQALDQLETIPEVDNEEIPTTGKPKQDKTKNPPKSTSTPKDQSHAKPTPATPSGPVSTPEDPNSHRSKRCSGDLAYQDGVKGKDGPSYCAYEFKKDDDKSCSAVPQERFVADKKSFSGLGDALCSNAKDGKIICLCEGDKCNNNTEAISKKLKEFLEKEGSKWKQDCLTKLKQIAGKSKGSGDGKSTTPKVTEEPEKTPEGGTVTEAPEEKKHSTRSPSIPTTTTPSFASAETSTKSTTAENTTEPESTPADGTATEDSDASEKPEGADPMESSTTPADGDTFETTESTTIPPTATTSEGEYQDDTTQFDATTSESPDESALDDDPTTVVTTEETSTTEDPDKVETEVKSSTVPPVVTTTEMTTVSSEGATTTVATTTTTSTKEAETTTQTVSSDIATTSEASTTTETTTTTQSTTSTYITTTTPETTTTTITTTTTSETPTEEPETTAHTEPENEQDTTTTPGSGIPEAEATSGVETTTGQAGNGGSNDNQGSLGAEGSVNEGKKEDKTGGGLPGWLIALLVFLALLAICLIIGGFILTREKKEDKVEDIEGGQKTAEVAAPPAPEPPVAGPEPPVQSAPVVKPAPPTGPVVLARMAPLPPQHPNFREQIMKDQLEKLQKLNAALDAAKKAPAVPAVPEVVPPKKEEVKAPVVGQVQVVDEQLPVLPTQEDNSLKEAPKVEAVKETSWKEKATQGTVDSVKTQASESNKSEKKKSSPPKELPKNDV